MSQTSSFESSPARTKDDYSQIMKEMRSIRSFMDEMKSISGQNDTNSISKTMQQMTQRHDEIIKIVSNTLPTTMNEYKQNIIDCCDANYKKRMSLHENVLKGYLQKIAQRLQQLYQEQQVTVNMALKQETRSSSNINKH